MASLTLDLWFKSRFKISNYFVYLGYALRIFSNAFESNLCMSNLFHNFMNSKKLIILFDVLQLLYVYVFQYNLLICKCGLFFIG